MRSQAPVEAVALLTLSPGCLCPPFVVLWCGLLEGLCHIHLNALNTLRFWSGIKCLCSGSCSQSSVMLDTRQEWLMMLIHPWAVSAASARLGLSHQEGNREQTLHIRDNWQQGSCVDTAIISFIFLFPNCKMCDCPRRDHLQLYCDLRKPLNLFLLSFGQPDVKQKQLKHGRSEKIWKMDLEVWSEPALQRGWKRRRADLSLDEGHFSPKTCVKP